MSDHAALSVSQYVKLRFALERSGKTLPEGTVLRLIRLAWTDGPHGPKTVPYCLVETPWGPEIVKDPLSALEALDNQYMLELRDV